jgi:hypothetical protein
LLAAGANPASLNRGGSPLSYLAKVRAADGHYRYSSSSDQTPVWVTGQVLTAVDGKPYPIAAVPRSAPAPAVNPAPAAAPTGGTAPGKTPPASSAPTGGATAPAPAAAPATGGTSPALLADTGADTKNDDSGPSPALLVAGGIAAACALAGGGWFLYRRRLA